MTAHIMCLTSSGGIPIFSRKKGEGNSMSYSKMASLNGIHMFLKSQDIKLNETSMSDTTVVWKEYSDSIILIAIASGNTSKTLENLIDCVYNGMVLAVGLNELKNPRNVEKLKKELRCCTPIIDKLLECLDIGDRSCTGIDLIGMSSCILCPDNHFIKSCLDTFLESLDSTYGCVIIHGYLAAATDSWWQLDPIEKKLLAMVISLDKNCTTCDLPVFLPKMSPNVAFRLISVTLVTGIQLLALCGPNPDLNEVEKLTIQFWRNHIDVLKAAALSSIDSYLPDSLLDPSILGFLLVDTRLGKFVINKNLKQNSHPIGNHKLDVLRTFYYQAVEVFLTLDPSDNVSDDKCSKKSKCIRPKETYSCSEYYKCHALKEKDNIICILYTYSLPVHTIRMITRKTLRLILIDRQIAW